MTTSPTELERLRSAFAALAAGPSNRDDQPSGERILQAVRGELSPEETRKIVDLVSRDPEVAEAWRLAREVDAMMDGPAEVVPMPRPRRRQWLAGLAAAAVVTLGFSIALFWQGGQRPTTTFRDSGEITISSELRRNDSMARDAFHLRWTGGPEGSSYDLVVSTSDLRVLTRVERLASPNHLVPEEVFTTLPSGAAVLWRVEATGPNGDRLASSTFVQHLQ